VLRLEFGEGFLQEVFEHGGDFNPRSRGVDGGEV
jgi:hypothetical protein